MVGVAQLERRVRKVERELGVPVYLVCNFSTPQYFSCCDNEIENALGKLPYDGTFEYWFIEPCGTRSRWERNLKAFHEKIYHARAKVKYRLQGGKCSRCGRNLNGSGECNHIVHRSKGRDDRLSNLEIVCPSMSNGCDFHQREHGLTGQRKTV